MVTAGARILVTVASRHGSTSEIAERLAAELPETDGGRFLGLTAVLQAADRSPDPSAFDAVVAGSAVYAGRWLEPAREYVSTHAAALRGRPVWLFSSGPIGPAPFPPDEPHDASPLAQLIGARGHRVFPGRLDEDRLSVGERAMVTAMRAPLGDFRDWAALRAWAEEITADLAGARA
ncbi:MAG TPA: flavodoxin domain-containing protein [Actinomycetospora sp.]|nr:flavodoxin domain-containing protein [Actinomycetospora sp.]